MTPGVRVVRLDDVAEEERGAAVGVAELERVVDPYLTLASEDDQQCDEREDEHDRDRMVDRGDRDEQADRRERCVDEKGGIHEPRCEAERDAVDEALARCLDEVVGRELRAEGEDVDGPVLELGVGDARGREHEHRPDGVPGVQWSEHESLDRQVAPHDVGEVSQREPRTGGERDAAERQEEEHRDEDELRREKQARADLEPGARRGGEREDQRSDSEHARRAR